MTMSHPSSESNNCELSDDGWSGKRSPQEDKISRLSDSSKRARLDTAGQDFSAVSPHQDCRPDGDREASHDIRAVASQPSSCLSSPLSIVPSHFPDDCGEIAQKAMEAWHSTIGVSNSNFSGQRVPPATTNKIQAPQTSLPPMISGSPASRGSIQAQTWSENAFSSGDRLLRKPLPTQKEPRMPDAISRNETSPVRANDFAQGSPKHQDPEYGQVQLPNSLQALKPSKLSLISDASEQQAVGHLDEYSRTIPKDSIELSGHDTSLSYTEGERPELSHLSSLTPKPVEIAQLQGAKESQGPVSDNARGLDVGLNRFPSQFFVSTAETVQRNQAPGRGGRGRGKTFLGITGTRVENQPLLPSALPEVAAPQSEPTRSRDGDRLEFGLTRAPSPRFRYPVPKQPASRGLPSPPATNGIPHVHYVAHPQRSVAPPLGLVVQSPYQPSLVVFTLDNRVESPLSTSEVRPLFENFIQNTEVLLPIPTSGKEATVHPVGAIMWQGLQEFYKWHTDLSKVKTVGPLRFELLDVQWQEERLFDMPEGSLDYFRIIKQYIWDYYWTALNINKEPQLFRVLVTQFSPPAPGPHWSSVNAKNPDVPAVNPHGCLQQSPGNTESRSGPQSIHQQSSDLLPSLPSMVTGDRPESSSRQHQETPPLRRSGLTSPSGHVSRNSFDSPQRMNHGIREHPSPALQSVPKDSPFMGNARTTWDRTRLRERALGFLIGRPDLEPLEQESTVMDKRPYQTGAEVCGVVIDRHSGKGKVSITGKGYITQNIMTGPDQLGDRYQDVCIQSKQTCMLHGEVVVLFYKRKPIPAEQQPPVPKQEQGSQQENQQPPQRPNTGSDVDIRIRIQIDGSGKYSSVFEKSILRPRITTTEFFAWFATQSNHCPPHGPPYLKFTFKDAMPVPMATEIARGNEDHFNYMRKDIKAQCEKARKYMSDLREFVILVTVPDWTAPDAEEEEEW